MMNRLTLAVTALLVSVPVVAWWLPGDLTSEKSKALAADGEVLDHMVDPLPLGSTAELVIGIVAGLVLIAAAVVLIRATMARQIDPRWWIVLGPLCAAGAVVGFGWRMITAGGIGANVGGGLTLLFGLPIVAVLLIVAGVNALALRRRFRPQPEPETEAPVDSRL
jgi:hypothetical protein